MGLQNPARVQAPGTHQVRASAMLSRMGAPPHTQLVGLPQDGNRPQQGHLLLTAEGANQASELLLLMVLTWCSYSR